MMGIFFAQNKNLALGKHDEYRKIRGHGIVLAKKEKWCNQTIRSGYGNVVARVCSE
jgi:hypothetical protein